MDVQDLYCDEPIPDARDLGFSYSASLIIKNGYILYPMALMPEAWTPACWGRLRLAKSVLGRDKYDNENK